MTLPPPHNTFVTCVSYFAVLWPKWLKKQPKEKNYQPWLMVSEDSVHGCFLLGKIFVKISATCWGPEAPSTWACGMLHIQTVTTIVSLHLPFLLTGLTHTLVPPGDTSLLPHPPLLLLKPSSDHNPDFPQRKSPALPTTSPFLPNKADSTASSGFIGPAPS
jgi:hypothetical protein